MYYKYVLLAVSAAALLVPASAGRAADPFRFTVTADMRGRHSNFDDLCQEINTHVGGPGAFHVGIGDIDGRVWENRAVIDTRFGTDATWYPVIGNHEEEDGVEMEWLRDEYDNGNGSRTPLSHLTNADGPVGTQRGCYTWDHGNAHFIAMNPYWNGGTNEGAGQQTSGDDTATDGDVVPALRNWLAADLAGNTKPFVFVLGHEPAFPENRHVGDSLDKYPANRDAFWQVLEDNDVQAFMNGHTHYYSKHQGDKNNVGETWQIDVGHAGNYPAASEPMTFLHVTVGRDEATIEVWRGDGVGDFALADSIEVVPEPATLALLAVGGLGVLARRKKRSWRSG